MARVHDLVKYILDKKANISAMKLHKLLYYCQAWSIVWDSELLFEEDIEAWVGGPVVRELYQEHKGKFIVNAKDFTTGKKNVFTENQIDTIDKVLESYGEMHAQVLSDLTHSEKPWRITRKGLDSYERGSRVIKPSDMEEFYSALSSEENSD